MKLKVKIKRINRNIQLPEIIDKGDWIDLRASEKAVLEGPQSGVLKYHVIDGNKVGHREVTFSTMLIPLGIAMKLPKGFEAVILPRSSTFKNFGITLANSEGVIDYTYQGEKDEWKFNAIAFRDTTINEGDRICQFRIQLSQKATMWQKIKWLFCSGVQLVEVPHLSTHNRGGHGVTGVK